MIQFSPIIIGCMRFGAWGVKMSTNELERFIDECLELGLNDFDHADIYGGYTTESQFGEVIRRRPDLKQKIQVTTKCGIKMVCEERPNHKVASYDSGSAHILKSVDRSLSHLGIETIDLLLLHRPDYLMDPFEISDVFEELSDAGKVKHFGVSNFSTSQFDLINDQFPLVTNQIEASLLHLDAFSDGTIDQCFRLGIQPTIWSPFGGGRMFGQSDDERILRLQKKLEEFCEKYRATSDQIQIAWLLCHPSQMIPILGTSKIERVKAARAAREIQLSKEDWYDLLQVSMGESVP
jgi:predicted oxidoreductase